VREAIDVDDFEPGEIETVEEPLGEMHRRSATG
jgi:hypothetical protein